MLPAIGNSFGIKNEVNIADKRPIVAINICSFLSIMSPMDGIPIDITFKMVMKMNKIGLFREKTTNIGSTVLQLANPKESRMMLRHSKKYLIFYLLL
jgi:hypothetical protein